MAPFVADKSVYDHPRWGKALGGFRELENDMKKPMCERPDRRCSKLAALCSIGYYIASHII